MKLDDVPVILGKWSLRPGSLHQRLSFAIEDSIRQGNFLPGTRLPAERTMAKSLAISRTTVLTASNSLRTAGWLESQLGSATWVSRKSAAAARASTQRGVIARSPLLNLLTVRESGLVDFAVTTTEPLAGLPLNNFNLPQELQHEDEALADFSFAGKRPHPVAKYGDGATVLTISSLSKLYCPGLRVGWIRGASPVIERLAKVKSAADLGSPLLTQAVGAQLFADFDRIVILRRQELTSKVWHVAYRSLRSGV